MTAALHDAQAEVVNWFTGAMDVVGYILAGGDGSERRTDNG